MAEPTAESRQHVEPWPDDYSDGDWKRYCYVTLPTCPACDSREHRVYRTDSEGDGGKTQWATCKTCGHKYFIVWEIPSAGKCGSPLC